MTTLHPDAARPWRMRPYDDGWTLPALLESAGAEHADRPAIVGPDGVITTFGVLRRDAARVRGAILAALDGPPGAVACMCALGPQWYTALLAIFSCGRPHAALDPEAPAARTAACLDDCGAAIIVCDRASLASVRDLGDRPVVVIEDAVQGAVSAAPVAVAPEDVAAYLFTSGSTGRSKIVTRSHRSFVHAIYSLADTYGYDAADVMLYPGSPAHVGTLNDALSSLLTGMATLPIGLAQLTVARVCELLALPNHPITRMAMPPSMLRLLLREVQHRAIRHHLRVIVASGEPLLRSDVGLFLEVMPATCALWQNYGSTETGPMMAGRYTADDLEGSGPLPLRRPAHGCTLELLTPRGGEPVAAADTDDAGANTDAVLESGEVVVRSAYLADGYLQAPNEDTERFGADERGRYFRTGDFARRLPGGELVILGRGDRQVKIHGRRFDLGDIESAILGDRSWREAVVIHRETEPGRPSLVAVVCPTDRLHPTVEALAARLERDLPPAAVPRRFLVLESMPRTLTGKIDLAAVASMVDGHLREESKQTGGPPRGALENWIADCWEYVLGINRPGRDERFMDVGGDSVAALELVLLLEQRLGVRLSLDRIAEAPSIALQAELCEHATWRASSTWVPLVPAPRAGQGAGEPPLLLMIPGLGGHAWVYAHVCRALATRVEAHAVSIVDLDPQALAAADRATFVNMLVEALGPVELEGDRQVVIVGYSLGARIACDLATALRERGAAVARILFIDPSSNEGGRQTTAWRRALRSARRRMLDAARRFTTRRSSGAAAMEAQINRMWREMTRLYDRDDTSLGDIEAAMIVSSEGSRPLEHAATLFGRPLECIPRTDVACGHLDLMQRAHVADTARWLDLELASIPDRSSARLSYPLTG